MGERETALGYNRARKRMPNGISLDVLNDGENVVLEVYRWSAGAYLECQDKRGV